MPDDALSREQDAALAALAAADARAAFYLAGGVGLALQLAHRRSADLDFFSPTAFDPSTVGEALTRQAGFVLEQQREATLHGRVAGVPVSFFAYPYPMLRPLVAVRPGLNVASPLDIGAMKLSAILRRGLKRDFIDLHAICRELPLKVVVDGFLQKAGREVENPYNLARALVYFVDAEKDAPPEMLKPVAWDDVKRFFEGEVRRMFG